MSDFKKSKDAPTYKVIRSPNHKVLKVTRRKDVMAEELQCKEVICPASHVEFEKVSSEIKDVVKGLAAKPSTIALILIMVPVLVAILGWVGYLGNKQISQLQDMHISQQEMTIKMGDVDSSLSVMQVKYSSLITLIETKIRSGDKDHKAHEGRIHRLEEWMDRTSLGRADQKEPESMVGG